MIIARPGERVVLRAPVSTRHGRGALCVTDRAVACEVHGRGIYLNFVPRAQIRAVRQMGRSPSGSRLSLEWDEGGSACRFEFRSRDPAPLLSELAPQPPSSSSQSRRAPGASME